MFTLFGFFIYIKKVFVKKKADPIILSYNLRGFSSGILINVLLQR